MTEYRVVDLRNLAIDAHEIIVEGATSPEKAAAQALDMDLVRSGAKNDLAAGVYWQTPGQPLNMVRLYKKVAERA